MNKAILIGAAIAAALGTQSASALDGAGTLAAQVKLVVSGASAQRDTFKERLTIDFCAAGTFDQYSADDGDASTSEDFRAYSCTLDTNASKPNVPVAIESKTVVVYYRSEGGSVYGVGPLLGTNPRFAGGVKRLALDSTWCSNWNTANTTHTCSITSYDLATDAVAPVGRLVDDPTLLGVSDVEPAQFIDPNWPTTSVLGATPTASQLNALQAVATPGTGTVWGVMVSDVGSTALLTNLAKEQVTNILNGTLTDWNKVINPSTNLAVSAVSSPIRVCRRERGSGTQVSAQAFFLQTNCSKTGQSMPDGGTGNFIDNNTGAAETTCVATAESIGYASLSGKPTGAHYIAIDGVVPDRSAAALGQYPYNTEVTFQRRSGLAGDPSTLANALISAGQKTSAQPVGNGVKASFGLPGVGGNTASIANAKTDPPTAIGLRTKNTCKLKGTSL